MRALEIVCNNCNFSCTKKIDMKKLLSVLLLFIVVATAHAQRGDVEKAMQEKYMKEHGAAGMAKLEEMMGGMMNAKTASEYTFPISMDMQVITYKNGKQDEDMLIKYYLNNSANNFAFETKDNNKNMTIVYDTDNNSMVMIDEAQNSYMSMDVNAAKKMGMDYMAKNKTANAGDVDCSKSGKTKTIQGYPCQQMVCIDKEADTKTEIWFTNKIPVNIADAAKGGPWAGYFHGLNGMSGMMMEGNFYEHGTLEAAMKVTNVNKAANKKIQLSKYNKMNPFDH